MKLNVKLSRNVMQFYFIQPRQFKRWNVHVANQVIYSYNCDIRK